MDEASKADRAVGAMSVLRRCVAGRNKIRATSRATFPAPSMPTPEVEVMSWAIWCAHGFGDAYVAGWALMKPAKSWAEYTRVEGCGIVRGVPPVAFNVRLYKGSKSGTEMWTFP